MWQFSIQFLIAQPDQLFLLGLPDPFFPVPDPLYKDIPSWKKSDYYDTYIYDKTVIVQEPGSGHLHKQLTLFTLFFPLV